MPPRPRGRAIPLCLRMRLIPGGSSRLPARIYIPAPAVVRVDLRSDESAMPHSSPISPAYKYKYEKHANCSRYIRAYAAAAIRAALIADSSSTLNPPVLEEARFKCHEDVSRLHLPLWKTYRSTDQACDMQIILAVERQRERER